MVIAALVFIASIVVPLTKLLALTWLLVSVQMKSRAPALPAHAALTGWWNSLAAGRCWTSTWSR